MHIKSPKGTPKGTPLSSRHNLAIIAKDYPIKIRDNLWSNDEHKKFFYRFKYNKETFRGIIDFTKKSWNKKDRIKQAEFELLKEKQKVQDGIDDSATVDKLVSMYMDTLKDGSYKSARQSFYDRKVKKQLGSKQASKVLPAHIQKIVNLTLKDYEPSTTKQILEVLNPAFVIGQANRILTHNPCDAVILKLPSTKKIVSHATQKLKIIYDAIMKLYKDDPFYRAFFLLALQGRRKSEVRTLMWEDVVIDHDYYIIRDTKNDEEQKIFLPPNVKDALSQFIDDQGPVFKSGITGRPIVDAKRQVAKLKKETGDWFSMHYTRNVMVSAMAEQGVDAIYMSGALGHSDPNTVTKYLTMNYLKGSKIASNMIQG